MTAPRLSTRLKTLPKGVAWSPDGTCLLTACEDCRLQLFEVPEAVLLSSKAAEDAWRPSLSYNEAEAIYDYAWYPMMHSTSPITCCFAASSRDHPIHLWDAFTGGLRATYAARDHLDEVPSALSLSFSGDGTRLYAGYERTIRVFVTADPGLGCVREVSTSRKQSKGLRGLVGSLAVSSSLLAAGSYARCAFLFDEHLQGPCLAVAEEGMGGVTALQFDPRDATKLWTGSRRDRWLRCWDLRKTDAALLRLDRPCDTNQRLGFHVGADCVATGSDAGLLIFKGTTPHWPCATGPPVNGCAFHPHVDLLAVATGQRVYDARRQCASVQVYVASHLLPVAPNDAAPALRG